MRPLFTASPLVQLLSRRSLAVRLQGRGGPQYELQVSGPLSMMQSR
jgi:hypothetical protein